MFGLTLKDFLRAVLAGFAATFVMEIAGFWQTGLKIARIDGAKFLAENAKRPIVWGEFAHYLNGIALAVVYARWLERHLPGPAMVKGLIFGFLTAMTADGITTPLINPSLGPFFSKTPRPARLGIASLIDHILYGITVGLGYEAPRGERDTKAKD